MIYHNNSGDARFALFGTPRLATVFLDDLEKRGLVPCIIVSTPDKQRGRGMELTPPPVKLWGEARGIRVLQPEKLDEACAKALSEEKYDFFVVIYYGKVLPKSIFDIPPLGTINVHFSLLPRWKGTSPVRAAILHDEKKLGTSLLLMDEKIDHGPLIAQKEFPIGAWPPSAAKTEETATHESAELLANIVGPYIRGEIEAQEQNHDVETWCPKIEKADGELDLSGDAYRNLLKIRAFDSSVGTYAFFERPPARPGQAPKRIRVQILDAHLEEGQLVLDTVKPEGKREMLYTDFLRSGVEVMPNDTTKAA